MVEKIMLSDKEYEYLTKEIAIGVGVGIGIVSGMVLEDIVLGFSAGGVIGIIVSFVYSYDIVPFAIIIIILLVINFFTIFIFLLWVNNIIFAGGNEIKEYFCEQGIF